MARKKCTSTCEERKDLVNRIKEMISAGARTPQDFPSPIEYLDHNVNSSMKNKWMIFGDNYRTTFARNYKNIIQEELGLKPRSGSGRKGILRNGGGGPASFTSPRSNNEISDDMKSFMKTPNVASFMSPLNSSRLNIHGSPKVKTPVTFKMFDCDATNVQELFMLRPKAFSMHGRKIVPIAFFLPFRFDPKLIEVVIRGERASISFVLPQYLMHPNRISGQKCQTTHVVYQEIYNLLRRLIEKKGDEYKVNFELILPFLAEPFLATDILQRSSINAKGAAPASGKKSHISVIHTYAGPTFRSEQIFENNAEPKDFCDSLVLLFREEETNFDISTTVASMKVLDLSCSDESGW